jgi:hypothetical protein
MPMWIKANQDAKRVFVIEPPTWTGKKFESSAEAIKEVKGMKVDILIPVILPAES